MKRTVIAILVMTSLAGCTDEPVDVGSESIEVEPGLVVGSDAGVLRGQVFDAAGFELEGARVSVLSTSFFANTDEQGRFQFVNVSAGAHRLQVIDSGHSPFLDEIQVAAGNITEVEIRLLPESADPTGRQHLHDFWGGQETFLLMDRTLDLAEPEDGTPVPDIYWSVFKGVLRPFQNSTMWRVPILEPPDGGRPIILPGTAALTLTAAWSDPATELETMGWCFTPTNWEDRDSDHLCTGPKPGPATWEFPIDPRWHDSGHASWSQWEVYLYTPGADEGARPGVALGSVDVSITLHRGEVPPEPPHPSYWDGGSSVVVHDETQRKSNLCCSTFWTYRPDGIVPPGTTRVVIEHAWTSTALIATAGLQDYQLMVRTAGMNPQTTGRADMLQPEPVTVEGDANEGRKVYELELGPLDADPFYLTRSAWAVSLYNTAFDRDMYDIRGGTVDHHFLITAYNDDI